MAASAPISCLSASVCVHFSPELCPKTLVQATSTFGPMGDIARIDMTLSATTGRILVTYFDIRSAEKVLQEFQCGAELFPPAAHDFRAVSIATAICAELPASFGGFHAFGEIAGVSICGEDMVVEFYDMRAAQQVTVTIPGSRPRPCAGSSSASGPPRQLRPSAPEVQGVPAPQGLLHSYQDGLLPQMVGLCDTREPALSGAGTAPDLGHVAGGPVAKTAGVVSAGPGKPNREKVNSKDLSKFDIVPEQIRNVEDLRTTVMVRNIPKACTRENFVDLLIRGGLEDRYSFFYMPFDKRRNIHCGFAFVNFKSPLDVLQLFECMQTMSWRTLCHGQQPPALSYARLQGQEQLMKHFSLSAVMYDNDARKRPVFFRGEPDQDHSAPMLPSHTSENLRPTLPAKVNFEHQPVSTGMQPRYVDLPALPGPVSKKDYGLLNGCDFVREAAFLMSNAAGA